MKVALTEASNSARSFSEGKMVKPRRLMNIEVSLRETEREKRAEWRKAQACSGESLTTSLITDLCVFRRCLKSVLFLSEISARSSSSSPLFSSSLASLMVPQASSSRASTAIWTRILFCSFFSWGGNLY